MSRPSSRYPTELELEILKILWQESPLSVSAVRERLIDFRQLAHTSVMTMMGIMFQKGYLNRSKEGRGYLYSAAVTEDETTSGIMDDIVDRVFSGSPKAAMLNLLDVGDIDDAELDELRKMINKRIRKGRG